jgi:hypothetical protein
VPGTYAEPPRAAAPAAVEPEPSLDERQADELEERQADELEVDAELEVDVDEERAEPSGLVKAAAGLLGVKH